MIGIIDYGAGNLKSVHKALEHLGAQADIISTPEQLERADRVILPGVGAFGKAVEAMDRLRLREPLKQVIADGRPFLGICLGLQLLMQASEESPGARGLGILPGSVVHFPAGNKVPHLGWNRVRQNRPCALWRNIPDDSFFYFAHSYYVCLQDETQAVGLTDYGEWIPVALNREALFGVQFHPEKSQKIGLMLLDNFIHL
ncbi:imidazole glycerol phosphate synthase subunit HisH [bacterium]|nr:imidazole glycerol phosphate synthase subunit HisH [bacterium]